MHCLDYVERPQPYIYLLCCINWYFWGILHSSLRIRIHSFRIRTAVKFYNHTLRLRYSPLSVGAYRMNTVIKNHCSSPKVVLYKPLSLRIRQPNTCESAFNQSGLLHKGWKEPQVSTQHFWKM